MANTSAPPKFSGFPSGTLRFLRGLRRDNSKQWFDAHRADYDAFYVEAAKAFVVAVGAKLAKLSPEFVADPRINGSIFRINKDVRFSKDKRPYKDHLDFSFWEGGKKASSSALFFRVSPDGIYIGTGHHSCPEMLKRFREAVADPASGKELAAVARKLRKAGHKLEGEHYKRTPRGFADDGPAAEFLLHQGLYVVAEDAAEAACSPEIVDLCLQQWRETMPLHRWLTKHVRA
ncbi:MAG: DUF2461 domain-containing protein [Planctomycetales bacterium]|nr:DUF2461 domain-containing protein [Planctomycetales bacterium]